MGNNSWSKVKRAWSNFRETTKDQGLIWWLIDKQRTWWKQIIAFILFVFLFRFANFTMTQALIMVGSMFLHELGHALVFWLTDIDFVVLYIFPLGAVAAPANKEENARSDELPWVQISFLLLAGPMVNLLLMALGTILGIFPNQAVQLFGQDLVFINSILLIMNIIPVWNLDAGQFFKLIYSSMTEKYDRLVSVSFTILILMVIMGTLLKPGSFEIGYTLGQLINNFSWIAFAIVFLVCNWYTQGKDDPKDASSSQRMNSAQIVAMLTVYAVLVFGGLILL